MGLSPFRSTHRAASCVATRPWRVGGDSGGRSNSVLVDRYPTWVHSKCQIPERRIRPQGEPRPNVAGCAAVFHRSRTTRQSARASPTASELTRPGARVPDRAGRTSTRERAYRRDRDAPCRSCRGRVGGGSVMMVGCATGELREGTDGELGFAATCRGSSSIAGSLARGQATAEPTSGTGPLATRSAATTARPACVVQAAERRADTVCPSTTEGMIGRCPMTTVPEPSSP